MTQKMMLIDAHIHTAGISTCSQVPADKLVRVCAEAGLDGFVLTNHYKRITVRGEFSDWSRRYVDEYEYTKEAARAYGLKVFFGVEFTLDCMPKNDFTVYGLDKELVATSGPLFTMSFEELCSFVHEHDALIYHAHPFRNTLPVDGRFLDGTEINCHPLYYGCEEKRVRAFADQYDLRISCGSDFHGDTYMPHCGMYVPADIRCTADLVRFLKEEKRPELLVAPDPVKGQSVAPTNRFW